MGSALTFLLVCPFLIWAVGCVYLLESPGTTDASPVGTWLSPYVIMLAFLSLVSSYVAAAGPALLAGAAYGWVQSRRSLSPLAAAGLGFGLGLVAAVIAALAVAQADATVSASPAAVGLVGGLSALVAALVARRMLGANNSSKPTPLRGAD